MAALRWERRTQPADVLGPLPGGQGDPGAVQFLVSESLR